MPDPALCCACRQPRTDFACEACGERTCRKCAEILPEGTFSFLAEVPAALKHSRYCRLCFDREVQPAREAHDEILARAREAFFFFKTQVRPLPIVRRATKALRIEACADRDETILRLGFLACEAGYNGIVDAEITSEKVRNEGWQTSRWKGVGVPAEIDAERFGRRQRMSGLE